MKNYHVCLIGLGSVCSFTNGIFAFIIFPQYMQRGGAWDNSDVKGAKKKNWLGSDKEYASGGYKKSQSVSILGEGKGLDWTGRGERTGPQPTKIKFEKNYKAPTVSTLKNGGETKPKKKLFGLF